MGLPAALSENDVFKFTVHLEIPQALTTMPLYNP